MHLSRIDVHGFRCIRRSEADLPPGKILIVGDNACGKTTLLEAIYYLVTGRSFRTRADAEVLPWDAAPGGAALVRGTVCQNNGVPSILSMAITSDAKAVRIDGQPIQRLAGLWGRLRAVLFTPDDLQLVKGEPGNRRRYLDIGMSQISLPFLHHLQRYLHVLRQRNALLRRTDLGPSGIREQIEPWNTQLARHGAAVLQARFDFIRTLEPRAASYYDKISGQSGAGVLACDGSANVNIGESATGSGADCLPPSPETLSMRYINFLRAQDPIPEDEAEGEFLRLLRENLEDDIRRGHTEIGPHRDDFAVRLSGKPVRDFGSQGQIRSTVLALRLAEMEEMEVRTGESPLLLLDDLASELDPSRKERVLQLLQPNWQTFLTTTRRTDFPADSSFAKVIHLLARLPQFRD